MYTHIKGVQILISLLKQFNIRHIIISPGTRNTALAHSVENDSFFKCYSIVDERSAAFFALGIAEALDVPACVTCTAATATCNYMPAIKEAYEKNIQLIALTADQDQYGMFHMEDQCIDQVDMYHGFVKKAIDVPMVKNERDYNYANRIMNEAFLAVNHNSKGPVQINYRMSYGLDEISTFDVENLPTTRKINRLSVDDISDSLIDILEKKERILVVAGSGYDENLKEKITEFSEKFNCMVFCDTFSNVSNSSSHHIFNPKITCEILKQTERENIKPDLIITFGNIFYSTIKYFLPDFKNDCESWQIAPDGNVIDGYNNLTKVFECTAFDFFSRLTDTAQGKNNGNYSRFWEDRLSKIKYPEGKFTNFDVIRIFCKSIPKNSILHTSVLDSIRISNYVDMDDSVECYANIGADGIDGAFSTFLGQADNNRLSYLMIGDLSFLYDLNSLPLCSNSNVRILVINNYAGAEFHKNFGIERINTINEFVAAGHSNKIQQCFGLADFIYLQAYDYDSLSKGLNIFNQKSEKPIIFEVFTDADTDAKTLKAFWKDNIIYSPKEQKIRNMANKLNLEKLKNTKMFSFAYKILKKLHII